MKFGLYLLLALLLSSCGQQEGANNKNEGLSSLIPEKSVNISGQVFVVTQGRANIKLALVDVSAISEKNITQHLNSKQSERLAQQKMISPELESAKKTADSATATSNSADRDNERLFNKYLEAIGNGDATEAENRYNKSEADKSKLSNIAVSKRNSYRKLKARFNYFDSPEFYFEKLPAPIVTSKTDADGKFTLTLPSGKYAISATSSRDVFGTTEIYYWLVWVDTSAPNHSIMFSNHNMFETKCNECVQLKVSDGKTM